MAVTGLQAPILQPPSIGGRLRRLITRLPAFTREGQVVAFLVMSLTTGLWISGHLLLYFALAVALALLTVGFCYPFLNLRGIFVRRSVPPYAFAGERVFIELAVANRKQKTPSFSIVLADDRGMLVENREAQVHLPIVSAGRAERTGYFLNFPTRGTYRWRYIRVSSSFPFLVFERRQLIRFPSEMVVYPRPGRLLQPVLPAPAGSLRASRKRSRGYQDFHKLREYRLGDDARLIHWKSTARRGEMLLREFDSEGGESVLVLLDNQAEGRLRYGGKQELAISFLITLIRALWRESYRVTFACHGTCFFQIELANQRADFHRMLTHLAQYESRGEHSLESLIKQVKLPRKHETGLILVTDRTLDPAQLQGLWPSPAGLRVVSSNSAEFSTLFASTTGKVQW